MCNHYHLGGIDRIAIFDLPRNNIDMVEISLLMYNLRERSVSNYQSLKCLPYFFHFYIITLLHWHMTQTDHTFLLSHAR